jgi:hypothetical protein
MCGAILPFHQTSSWHGSSISIGTFEVFTTVTIEIIVFFEATLYNPVDRYHRFGGTCYLHHQGKRNPLPYTWKKNVLRDVDNRLPDTAQKTVFSIK